MTHRVSIALLCMFTATLLPAQEPLPPLPDNPPGIRSAPPVPESRSWNDIKRPAPHLYGSMDAAQIDTEIDRVLQEFFDTLAAEDRRINETLAGKDARHPLLLQVRAVFFTGQAELLREKLHRETDPAKNESLEKELRQNLDHRVESLDKFRIRRRRDFLAGTLTMDYYLDAEKRWLAARLEQVRAETDEQDGDLAKSVYEVLTAQQRRIASFLSDREEEYLLGKPGLLIWILHLRLALYEARNETDRWLLRHPGLWENRLIPLPIDFDRSKLPYMSQAREPKEVLKIRIDKNRADILRTADELVTATEAAWNVGTCTMTERVDAILYRHEARLIGRPGGDTIGSPALAKKRILDIFDADIETAEKMFKRQESHFSTNPRNRLYYLQARLLLRTLEHRRACQMLEWAMNEAVKQEARDEFRTTSDKMLQGAEIVEENTKRSFTIGMLRQKDWFDTLERLKSARLERLRFERQAIDFRADIKKRILTRPAREITFSNSCFCLLGAPHTPLFPIL